MRRSLIASAASSALALVSASCVIVDPSCSGGSTSIYISPSVVVVAVGQTSTPRASWCRGGRYSSVSPQWSLGQAADANVISVNAATGEITGKRRGSASVIATYEGVSGSRVQVTVE